MVLFYHTKKEETFALLAQEHHTIGNIVRFSVRNTVWLMQMLMIFFFTATAQDPLIVIEHSVHWI